MDARKREQVLKLLQDHPAWPTARIAAQAGLTMEEIKEVYTQLRDQLPALPHKSFGVPGFFRAVLERAVLPDRGRLDAFREGRFVFPDYLELHLGPACQCACRFCWRWAKAAWAPGDLGHYRKDINSLPVQSAGAYRDPAQLLELAQVHDLLREFKENGGRQLYLSGGLEFFTSAIAEGVIRAAAEAQLEATHVYTNGVASCFDNFEFAELLVGSAASIRFSLHAATPETCAYVQMPHLPAASAARVFEMVKARVERLVQVRDRMRSRTKTAAIGVAFLVLGKNLDELEAALNWMRRAGVDDCDIRVDMREEAAWFTAEETERLKAIVGRIRERVDRGEYQPLRVNARIDATADIRAALKEQAVRRCRVAFKKPAVDPWGFVWSCCYRAHPALQAPEFLLGKYPEQSLTHILKNARGWGCPRSHCRDCTDWEMAFNACVEKVLADWADGIPPERLPFSPVNDGSHIPGPRRVAVS